jgi:hypothetical protein
VPTQVIAAAPLLFAPLAGAAVPRAVAVVVAWAGLSGAATGQTARAAPAPAAQRDSIPGTLVRFEMVPVPGGRVTLRGRDGAREVEVKPFLIGRTELTWDAYDPFAFGPGSGGARGSPEAVSRPSRPYGAPDYGLGTPASRR